MNDDRMLETAQVAELAHLPQDDPRVVEALRSPRTRALLALYRDFVARPEAMPGADLTDADARLAAVLAREIGEAPSTADRRVAAAPGRRNGFLARLFAPAVRPALAFAALAIVAGTVWVMTRPSAVPGGGEPVMRGDTTLRMRAELVSRSDGRALLRWTAVSGAEHYELRFFGTDLVERARLGLGPETQVELLAGQLPVGLVSGEMLLWQAVAMKGQDVLAESATATIQLP